MRVYKFSFYKDSFNLIDDYDRLSDIDKELLDDLDIDSFMDYHNEDGNYSYFIIALPSEVYKYEQLLKDNLIQFDFEDISIDVLLGKIDIENYLQDFLDLTNTLLYQLFIDDLNEWLNDNLDSDIILDKISLFGIESLSKAERDYLDNLN